MARTATKKPSTKSLRSTGTLSPTPKRGRPPGSKNRIAAEPRKTTRQTARTAASRKAPPATPKPSKAELEAQVVKLERTVSRLREQNKELKRLVRDAAETAELAAAAREPTRRSSRVAAARSRRPRSSKPVRVDEHTAGAGADAEDHEAAA